MALAFDEGEMFGHDKPAGLPCHRLDRMSCSIHEDLEVKGYRGCVAFECLGAGQRVTAMFSENWRRDPALTTPMMNAFRAMRSVQELHQMMLAARALPLPDEKLGELTAWGETLEGAKTDIESLTSFDTKPARDWLKSLAPFISRAE